MMPTSDLSGLVAAIERLRRELPGWWLRLEELDNACFATVGPMDEGQDADLIIRDINFADGVEYHIMQPSTLADTLNMAIDSAIALRANARRQKNQQKPGSAGLGQYDRR